MPCSQQTVCGHHEAELQTAAVYGGDWANSQARTFTAEICFAPVLCTFKHIIFWGGRGWVLCTCLLFTLYSALDLCELVCLCVPSGQQTRYSSESRVALAERCKSARPWLIQSSKEHIKEEKQQKKKTEEGAQPPVAAAHLLLFPAPRSHDTMTAHQRLDRCVLIVCVPAYM